MINFNGELLTQTPTALENNRAFLYGDAVFETVRVLDGRVIFAEDHYFRLMASMRVLRMEIPMNFTMEYMEEQIIALTATLGSAAARARLTFYRNSGGFYLPTDNNTQFIITAQPLDQNLYVLNQAPYEVDLYKDFHVSRQLLSTLKSTNRLIQVTGSIYAHENGLNNCLVLNDAKNVAEALQGNLFMFMGNVLTTPPLTDGCLNGIMRKQVLALAQKIEGIEVKEASISPFELQKADELFITNVINGIQPVTKYRKKEFKNTIATELVKRLNAKIRFS
ncbi:aminotransferase class IV [Flavobacterium rhizosphaerae]|uniref:branched-chain-amino-acid transaminase n=1 Tax=Flavobacterium rhizosphaerae TaxID=3163298 RepID=A0ABW8YWR0_9FLAO